MSKKKRNTKRNFGRRSFLVGGSVAAGAVAMPFIWVPKKVKAETAGFNTAKHLIYIRLAGGFRFPTAFNGAVADEFNPFGEASGVPGGTEWGVGAMLGEDAWRDDEMLADHNLKSVVDITDQMAVIPCVDHEPLSGSADGNHQTGLERWLTGFAGGGTGIFTMINYALRERVAAAFENGEIILPAVVMGNPGMGLGSGEMGAYRPPVLRGDDIDLFSFSTDSVLPEWARGLSNAYDARFWADQNHLHRPEVESYILSREATKAYSEIFSSEPLKIGNGSDEPFDGISNAALQQIFGDDATARNIRLALRLFHYGCPAVYLDQGGYDYHSDEDEGLPERIQGFNRLYSGLEYALKIMEHPDGGSYWDHTIIAVGSEFSRSARGARFNSARGSDHGGDLATRWMSMPFMGGPINALGRSIGSTRPSDLKQEGPVFTYRSTMLSMMDALGGDIEGLFPADEPYDDLFV